MDTEAEEAEDHEDSNKHNNQLDIEEKENVNFECMRVGEHQSYDNNVFHLQHRVSELLSQVFPHPAPNRIPTVEMKGGNI